MKSTLSECVREVKSGRTIVVTEHRQPVARIIPDAVDAEWLLRQHAALVDSVHVGQEQDAGRITALKTSDNRVGNWCGRLVMGGR